MYVFPKYCIDFDVPDVLGWVYTALDWSATKEPWNIGFVDCEAHLFIPVGDQVLVGSDIKIFVFDIEISI